MDLTCELNDSAHPNMNNDMKKERKEMEMKEMNRGYKCKEPFGTLK